MKLSVIIPCFNGGATLATQLEALSAQQWSEPWELIIVDNGSTDNSVEVARKYKERFYAFNIIDASARRGGAYAVNMGAKVMNSDRLVCCDADDEVAPGWVASMGDALSKYDVVCGKFLFDKFNEPLYAKQRAQEWETGFYIGRFLPGGASGNFGIRRKVHEAIGGFDECLPHAYDADYFWRLQLEGFMLNYVPEAGIQIRVGRVNPTFPVLYRRARNRAASNYWCYKRYRHLGMLPPPPFKISLATWIYSLRSGVRACLQIKQNRFSWLSQFTINTGDLVGQLKGRITNPCKPYHPGKKGIEILRAYGFRSE